MSLFEFELMPIESIQPWGEEPNLSLSWFALTHGVFKINVGKEILFRYSKDIASHWDIKLQDADYAVAAFVRDFLRSLAPALLPIPKFLEPIAHDWNLLSKLSIQSEDHDAYYEAFRWLEERSPDTGYLTQSPSISFLRKENDIIIGWNNRVRQIEGMQVWESEFGTYTLSADDFVKECQSFYELLLDEMTNRIMKIQSGESNAQIALDTDALMKEHEFWRAEFEGYFSNDYEADFSWDEVQVALNLILNDLKIQL